MCFRGAGGVPDVRNCIRCPFGASYTVAWYVCIQPPSSISTMNLPAELVGAPHLSRTAREPTRCQHSGRHAAVTGQAAPCLCE